MRTHLQMLQDFSKNYSQETLLREQYTPTMLLNSFKSLIENTKGAVLDIQATLSNTLNNKPAYAKNSYEGSGFLNHNDFKTTFTDLSNKIKEYNYTNYASLKKAKVPLGMETYYVDILKSLNDLSSNDSLWKNIKEYKELLSKLMTQDTSVMRSSINRYTDNITKNSAAQIKIFNELKSKIKDPDKDFVKVSVVLSNANQWATVNEMCRDVNMVFTGDMYDIKEINNELKVIGSLIDSIIEDLSSKTELKGNSIVLSELSESTLGLAKAVTLTADSITLCIETLGCVYETMVAIELDQRKKD